MWDTDVLIIIFIFCRNYLIVRYLLAVSILYIGVLSSMHWNFSKFYEEEKIFIGLTPQNYGLIACTEWMYEIEIMKLAFGLNLYFDYSFGALTLLYGREEGHLASGKLMVCEWRFDWSFAYLNILAVTAATWHLLLQQNPGWFDILVPGYLGNWLFFKWLLLLRDSICSCHT